MTVQDVNFVKLLGARIQHGLDSPSILLGNLRDASAAVNHRILKTEVDRAVGYIAWGNVNKESMRILQRDFVLPKYSYEWNEGKLVLVADLLFGHQSRFTLRRLFDELFGTEPVVVFRKKDCVSAYIRLGGKFRLAHRTRRAKAQPVSGALQ